MCCISVLLPGNGRARHNEACLTAGSPPSPQQCVHRSWWLQPCWSAGHTRRHAFGSARFPEASSPNFGWGHVDSIRCGLSGSQRRWNTRSDCLPDRQKVVWERWLQYANPDARWRILESRSNHNDHETSYSRATGFIEWLAQHRSVGAGRRRSARLWGGASLRWRDLSEKPVRSSRSAIENADRGGGNPLGAEWDSSVLAPDANPKKLLRRRLGETASHGARHLPTSRLLVLISLLFGWVATPPQPIA